MSLKDYAGNRQTKQDNEQMTDWNKRNCKMVLSERDHRVETKLKIVICLPTEHLKVHKNSLKRVRAFQIELEFGSVGF